jgi:hypothetical protein
MLIQSTDLYVRTCQECGKRQECKPCVEYKGDSWRDKLCRFCKSAGLDYGSFGWKRDSSGGFYRESVKDDSED